MIAATTGVPVKISISSTDKNAHLSLLALQKGNEFPLKKITDVLTSDSGKGRVEITTISPGP